MLGSLALRAEKHMVGRAVTSDIGKKLLREYCAPSMLPYAAQPRVAADELPRKS